MPTLPNHEPRRHVNGQRSAQRPAEPVQDAADSPDGSSGEEAVAPATRRALDAVRDPERLAALRETGLLDTEVEEEFDRLTRLAARLLGVPATFFSLVDEDRDFYKSCFGFTEPLASERQVEGITFCHYSLVSEGALVISDTRADPIYRNVPTVESMGVAAYLGVPIRAPGGEVLGSFCAISFQPHDWSPTEVEIMRELGKSAEREVAIRHWMRRQSQLVDREREAREELERVMRSRERLIRGFSHDVKNPLGAADGFLALLEDGIFGPLEERQQNSISRVRRSIATAVGLINDVAEIARAEAGELEVHPSPLDLRELAKEITEEYRAQAETKGLRLRCECPEEFPTVLSDGDRIRQILGNLISNGVKYTQQGEVVVSVRLGEEEGAGERRCAVVQVVDTGPGIPAEQQHLLFREFSRLEPAVAPGAGLGLAISASLAQALGGAITVQSAAAQGSTFTLKLPM